LLRLSSDMARHAARETRQAGLTLIELLVVLAIIAVLAAIAIPNYAAFRKRAYEAEAKECLGELRKLAWVFFMENGAFPTLDQLEQWGYWKDPSGSAYEYMGIPPRYVAQPKPGGPADGMKSWVMIIGTDGSATLQ
jgi:type IV pilus assembly protein PilA